MSDIPEYITKRGLELAQDATYRGVPMLELTHDEAIAAAAILGDLYHKQIEESIGRFDAIVKSRIKAKQW